MKMQKKPFITRVRGIVKHFTALTLFCFFASCASFSSKDTTLNGLTGTGAIDSKLPAGNGLESAKFNKLPPEAKEYLQTLAEAFNKKDRVFLLNQGEAQFEKELRNKLDEESYLALLYRIGPYSEDSEWTAPKISGTSPARLNPDTVRDIEYTHWEEKGPLLEITGRLYVNKSDPIPCRIVLAWRLLEPKIQGVWY